MQILGTDARYVLNTPDEDWGLGTDYWVLITGYWVLGTEY
jgi:hypothetical protein